IFNKLHSEWIRDSDIVTEVISILEMSLKNAQTRDWSFLNITKNNIRDEIFTAAINDLKRKNENNAYVNTPESSVMCIIVTCIDLLSNSANSKAADELKDKINGVFLLYYKMMVQNNSRDALLRFNLDMLEYVLVLNDFSDRK